MIKKFSRKMYRRAAERKAQRQEELKARQEEQAEKEQQQERRKKRKERTEDFLKETEVNEPEQERKRKKEPKASRKKAKEQEVSGDILLDEPFVPENAFPIHRAEELVQDLEEIVPPPEEEKETSKKNPRSSKAEIEQGIHEVSEEIALKEVEGKILKAKEDKDDGVTYYDFTIITDTEKYEIEVDANSGKVLKREKDDDYIGTTTNPVDGTVTPITPVNTAVSLEEAQKIAFDRVGGGYLIKTELDYDDDDGIKKYEIEIKNGNKEYELEINADTGEIIKYEEDVE